MSKNKNIQRAPVAPASEPVAPASEPVTPASEPVTPASEPVTPASEPVAMNSDFMPKFLVKKGKSITSKRGILGDGQEIKVTDVHNGFEDLKILYEKGYIEVVE